MISFLSKWIEGIAIAVIIASILENILPKGNIAKYIKVVLGIFVIFSIISPFVDTKALYSIELPKELNNLGLQNSESKTQSQDLDKIYKTTFENDIKQTIEKKGYNVYKCSVDGTFNSDSKEAGITKIKIVLDSKNENYRNEIPEKKNESLIEVKEIEKIEIGSGPKKTEINSSKIKEEDKERIKKFLSEHYEIEQDIIEIQTR